MSIHQFAFQSIKSQILLVKMSSKRKPRNNFYLLMAVYVILLGSLTSQAYGAICPEFSGRGYDYTNSRLRKQHIEIVEAYHFTEDVRALRKGKSGYLIGDIEYTLDFFPNHHGALDAFARLALRQGKTKPEGAKADIECRFKWAENAQPQDPLVSAIRGVYYYRAKRFSEAKKYLEQAVTMSPKNAEINYNLGLTLFSLGEYDDSRKRAREAYKLGYPLPGLRNMLEEKNYSLDN